MFRFGLGAYLFFRVFFFLMNRPPPSFPLFPYPTLFRSHVLEPLAGRRCHDLDARLEHILVLGQREARTAAAEEPRKVLGEALAHHLERLAEAAAARSEEHTSELQSPCNLVCRLLLEKKN